MRGSEKKLAQKCINIQHACMFTLDWRNESDGELESETERSAGGGRWSWLNPCPEFCTNCGREAETIAERSPAASINKIN